MDKLIKRSLIIAAGNPYIFHGSWAPLIPDLSKQYRIVIVLRDLLNNFFTDDSELTRQMESWIYCGTIQKYFAMPDYADVPRALRFLKSIMPQLRAFNFDIIMSDAFGSAWVKYILSDGIPAACKKVVFHPNRPILAQQTRHAIDPITDGICTISSAGDRLLNTNFWQRIKQAQKRQNKSLIHLFVNKLQNYVCYRFSKTVTSTIVTNYVLPALVVGKCFPNTKHDMVTGFGNDFNAAIFLEDIFAEDHKKYFNKANIYVAQHPGRGYCRCHDSQTHKTKLLTVLGSFVGSDCVPDNILATYRRDLQNVLRETGATEVHLRPHPRETGRWPCQLRDYLQASGIHASVVDSRKPIGEIVCDYIGTVGDLSWALHDARGYCDYAFVVVFAGVMNPDVLPSCMPDPKLLMGNNNGIEWIEEDGSYKEGIFKRRLHEPARRKTVLEILSEL